MALPTARISAWHPFYRRQVAGPWASKGPDNPYTSWAQLAANQAAGLDYELLYNRPPGATWSSIAIHGGQLEPWSGEMAEYVAGKGAFARMAYYEFQARKPAGNQIMHIESDLFDEPIGLSIVRSTQRTLSWHGYTGTPGVPETLLGGLDILLRDKIKAALEAAGFLVNIGSNELAGTSPGNICNDNDNEAGLQVEMSGALRDSFAPSGDRFNMAERLSGARTDTFYRYAEAVMRQ